ncbi:hsp70-binding protein 1 [Solanum pennellii]|uniref:Hsp70-binding protein 1 n=1 Tax=Solanum pennellii TaxID=28526 RepID=A0ABM1HQ70_SOLPN|nr:hsp70-binding protein 1 [Solanum pennellii]
MAKEGPNWDGLLKWSLSHADGTNPPPRNLSEEDRRWFMEAMQAQTVDVIKRMKEITLVMQTPEQVLESQGVTSQDIEDMLDELQEHVESIDMANDLNSIGGLVPLLGYLKNSHANIRAKAAEVVSTIVQNNPRSQQLVMEANGLEPLLSNFTSDSDVTARTKALGAISSLIRHNKPAIAAFRLANGYAGLRDALSSESVRFQRKALNLIHYLLHENRSDCNVVTELGFPRVMMHLASSDDGEVREGALRGLLDLAQDKTGEVAGSSSTEENEKLKQILQERIKGISSMSPGDLGAAKEERQLVDSLWNTCYNEPSSLREKGLVVLPGEDALPPDVASKHFEPPLRAWAANRNEDTKPSNEKKQAPLLLGLGPPTQGPPVQNSSSGAMSGEENRDTSA